MIKQRGLTSRLWTLVLCSVVSCGLVLWAHPGQARPSSPQPSLHRTISSNSPLPSRPASLSLAQSPPDRLRQGKRAYDAGQFADAAKAWTESMMASEVANDVLPQALASSYLSLAYQALGKWAEAEHAIAQAFVLLDQAPAESSSSPLSKQAIYAQALNTKAALQLAQGQTAMALETWQEAETIYAQLNDDEGRWGSVINQTQALQAMGLYHQAARKIHQITHEFQAQPHSQLTSIGLRSLGNILYNSGHLNQAQPLLEESLAIAQTLNLPNEINATTLSLGNLFKASGAPEQALEFYIKAADSATSELEHVKARLNQLRLFKETGQIDQQGEFVKALQRQIATLPPSRTAIYARVNFVDSLLEAPSSSALQVQSNEQFSPAASSSLLIDFAELLSTGVQQAQDIQDVRAEAYALGQLGRLYETTHQWQDAKRLTQEALTLSQTIQANDIAYRWDWQLGRILKQQNQSSKAIEAYSDAIALLQGLRRDLLASNPDLQFSFRQQIEPIYREFVSLLIEADQPPQRNIKQAREVIESLQLAELENFFRSACLDVQPKQIDDVDQTAAVIYPIILPDKLAVIVSLPGQRFKLYQTNISSTDVQQTVEEMLEALNPLISDQRRLDISKQLYDWLIQPAQATLVEQHIQTLVFVLDGGLRNIPMAALYDGEQYLVEQYQVAITPGLQLLASQQLSPDNFEVLVGGLTEARQGFDALPGVAIEADQIASNTSSKVYLNHNFTEANLQTQIGQTSFPVIHLATHGQFSSNSEDTFVLTWDDQITIEGLRQLLKSRTRTGRQPIELLVLSACQTAEGDERAALGLAGLSVRSGARSTLATLWAVNDQSTADFMSLFYKSLTNQHQGKANALRETQIEFLKRSDYSHPYFWAPFILVGNWQ